MKRKKMFIGLFLLSVTISMVAAMGAPQDPYEGGIAPANIFPMLLPLLILFGILALWIVALIRVIKALQNSKDTTMPIVALVALIVFPPVGIILSFAAVKKEDKPNP